MEFFRTLEKQTTPDELRRILNLDDLPGVCAAVDDMGGEEDLGRVVFFCDWGRFHLRREAITGGVRFWVPDCPNALSWTVTTGLPPEPDRVVLHATINRTGHEPEFIAATEYLLDTLRQGLSGENGPKESSRPRPEPSGAVLTGFT